MVAQTTKVLTESLPLKIITLSLGLYRGSPNSKSNLFVFCCRLLYGCIGTSKHLDIYWGLHHTRRNGDRDSMSVPPASTGKASLEKELLFASVGARPKIGIGNVSVETFNNCNVCCPLCR